MPVIKTGTFSHTFSASELIGLYTAVNAAVKVENSHQVVMPGQIIGTYNAGTVPFPSAIDVNFGYTHYSQVATMAFTTSGTTSQLNTTQIPYTNDGTATLTNVAGCSFEISIDADISAGAINTTSINAAGSGYSATDTFTFDSGSNGAGVIDTVNGSGAVLTYHITNTGGGFTAGTVSNTTSGVGTGFKVNINSITQGNGTLFVEFDYKIVEIPQKNSASPNWPVE